MRNFLASLSFILFFVSFVRADDDKAGPDDNKPPEGFKLLFNGKDLSGWQGLVELPDRTKLSAEQLAKKQQEANEKYLPHWTVKDGVLHYDGKGQSLQTAKDYGNFELWADWKIGPKGDSGLYLRGNPQVQIWDYIDKEKFPLGSDKGSGGLWNNSAGAPGKDPLVLADKPFGEWNAFRILMVGSRVSVWLNQKLVVDHAILENYYDHKHPVPPKGPIELQTHGGEIRWRNIFLREIRRRGRP